MASVSAFAKPVSTKKSNVKASSIRAIYTVVGCSHCHELERNLWQAGVKISKFHTSEYRYGAYPTVVYSDGRTDNGQRIQRRSVSVPRSVRIIEAN